MKDNYVRDMDWHSNDSGFNNFDRYRKYQYNLIKNYVGSNILEVGSGDRSFTKQILLNSQGKVNLLSIEPSKTLYDLAVKNDLKFPSNFTFSSIDLFDMGKEFYSKFDTIFMIHVLEHIKNDDLAIDHISHLLTPGGYLLIQVPALQWLFSEHDKSIGHYRRYNKENLLNLVNLDKFKVEKLCYQDPIGIIGSLIYFKFKKIKLKSYDGLKLVNNQGSIYNNYIIPFEEFFENYINFPIGLSLTIVLKKIV
jgi:2-polyprenyl-3-methyl-5-hydroxy-6-metoxy-1,4-benzoquinol methylase